MSQEQLLPLELWLKKKSTNQNLFPSDSGNHFNRYQQIKQDLEKNVYPSIGAATSAEDGGIYTDHSITHFNAVIRYAGKLLDLNASENDEENVEDIKLNPYEVFILLISILLHDAGNIFGRTEHEKKPLIIFKDMGRVLCPDDFEARFIAKIAEVHGGKAIDEYGQEMKDTIRNSLLKEIDTYRSVEYRPQLIAALVRFADEICEDRTRAARFLLSHNQVPKKSEIYHYYADAISSVDVDLDSKFVSIKYELKKEDVLNKKGKGEQEEYLIDEIINRLEKIYCELLYCRAFMNEVVPINQIRATVSIYDEDIELEEKGFKLTEKGYPKDAFSFSASYPDWSGEKVKNRIINNNGNAP